MSCKRLMLLALMAAPVAGCATLDPVTQSVDRHFGEAVAWNKEVQTINPDPVYSDTDAQPGDNGERAAAASRRHRTDRVRDVQVIGTSDGGAGGGSGGGSGPR